MKNLCRNTAVDLLVSEAVGLIHTGWQVGSLFRVQLKGAQEREDSWFYSFENMFYYTELQEDGYMSLVPYVIERTDQQGSSVHSSTPGWELKELYHTPKKR